MEINITTLHTYERESGRKTICKNVNCVSKVIRERTGSCSLRSVICLQNLSHFLDQNMATVNQTRFRSYLLWAIKSSTSVQALTVN